VKGMPREHAHPGHHHPAEGSIINAHQLEQLVSHLPAHLKHQKLQLLFSTVLNGNSLPAFYQNTGHNGPTLLLVRDSHHRIFGALATESWHVVHEDHFYGSAESMLFTFAPHGHLTVYPARPEHQQYQLGKPSGLILGGGGNNGLYLDADLVAGTTQQSTTYNNQPLTGDGEEIFTISVLEAWGFENHIKHPPKHVEHPVGHQHPAAHHSQ
jgi:hypothetical protein